MTRATGAGLRAGVTAGVAATLWLACIAGADAQDAPPPPAVVVAPAVAQDVARGDTFVGRTQAIQSVSLVARVEGFLTSVAFQEGQNVTAGDLMFEVEKGPYEADLAAANGQLAAAQAQLSGAQAQLKNQETILARQVTLLQRDTVSQATVDDATSARDAAAAKVGEAEAAIQQAQAQIQTAQLNLGYTTITTPITGRVGALAITEGNLVSSQSGTLATVVQLDPIRVAFSIPESLYVQLMTGAVGPTPPPGQTASRELFSPTLTLADGAPYDQPGKISFASNEIDQNTGTLVIYADFPNPGSVLLPGGFVRVRVDEAADSRVPVVPGSAILQDREGTFLFVVDSDNRAQQRRVEVGPQVETGIPVLSGLQPGELVVVAGLQKVRPGLVVAPTPAGSPAAPPSAPSGPAATPAAAPAASRSPSAATPSAAAPASSAAAPAAETPAPSAATAPDETAAPADNAAPASSPSATAPSAGTAQ